MVGFVLSLLNERVYDILINLIHRNFNRKSLKDTRIKLHSSLSFGRKIKSQIAMKSLIRMSRRAV